jgi:hypothetical protein
MMIAHKAAHTAFSSEEPLTRVVEARFELTSPTPVGDHASCQDFGQREWNYPAP